MDGFAEKNDHDRRPAGSARWALAGLSLSALLSSLDTSIANTALPTFAQTFGASFRSVQWVVLAYLLASTTPVVGVGRLGDLAGRRRLLTAGLGLFTGASLLCGLAPTLGLLVAARAAQGVGAAVMTALAVALVGEAVPRERAGGAMGLLGTSSAIGTALGPSLGGALAAGFGWRALFLVNLPLGALALLLVRRHLPADRRREESGADRPRFDAAGTLLLALTLAAYALAMTAGGGSFGPLNAALLAVAAAGVVLFLAVERRAASPLVRPEVLRDPALVGGLGASALVSTVMMSTLVVGPFYLARALGLDAARVGLAMSAGPLVAALAGVPAGRVADRFGARRMAAVGLVGIAAGCLGVAVLPATLGLAGYVAPVVVVTAHYALFQAANNAALMADARADRRGVVSGMLALSRNLGLVTGASAMGAVFALASGASDMAAASAAAVSAGMRATFAVAATLVVVALAVSVAGRALSAPALRSAPGVGA